MMMRASAVIEEWIASQQYDVGLAETPPPNAALAVETFELPCVCAMPKDDPLASREYIQPRDHGRPATGSITGRPSLT